MTPNPEELTFEQALRELETIVGQLESGNLTLEESLTLFERGQTLAKRCHTQLDEASLRVEQLTADGEIVEL
jgi:exodeoxyribonuclease VII small subunit